MTVMFKNRKLVKKLKIESSRTKKAGIFFPTQHEVSLHTVK